MGTLSFRMVNLRPGVSREYLVDGCRGWGPCSDEITAIRCRLGLTSGQDPLKLSRSLRDTRGGDTRIMCSVPSRCCPNKARNYQIWELRTGNCVSLPRSLRPRKNHPSLVTNERRSNVLHRTGPCLFSIILLQGCRSSRDHSKTAAHVAVGSILTLLEMCHHRCDPAANLLNTRVPREPPKEYPFGARCLCVQATG